MNSCQAARMTNQFSGDGRVVLITGSSQGIGLALATACAEAGAHIVINARSTDKIEVAVAMLRDRGHQATGHAADVTDQEQVEDMVVATERDVGPIAGLINNAGIQRRAKFLDFALDDYRQVMETNLVAPFLVAQSVGRRMAERGAGRIINIGSVQSQLGRPTIVPYAASKGGLLMMTRGMCADLGPLGIQVNSIAPGYFATELTEALVNDETFSQWVADRTPAGRWGQIEELGGAAVFLLSDAASFINGQTLFVDGGMTAVV